MDSDKQIPVKPIPANIDNATKVVLAIPAKPKPPAPWWQDNFGGLVIMWLCIALAAIIWMGE